MSEELTGTTGKAPYVQFETCPNTSVTCKYKDAGGRCIFEHCMYDTLPPTQMLHFFECIICKHIDAVDPREMKVHFCKWCIQRMQDAEVLPVKCKACGATISKPTDWIFSTLCQTCIDNLRDLAKPEHHDKLTRCYHCSKCPQ